LKGRKHLEKKKKPHLRLGERPIKFSWCQALAIVQTIGTWTIVVHNKCELAQKVVFNLPKRI